ncbi:MAG: hypothetical protein KME60_22140 [Cyanomargarita calcarea GSE-NOS-MK-12-04C]|jgi:hypothetical protein|uniref:Uncharacterized protein n=1 Tax=Cyanomargarita calcarea GSE-NOS-MK-12-04C TaxID=2839659 RepID=A0A951UUH1_9CYAN|nr:hypothetical protein [Cyanomargarita calcarea GSE-NOS-MK-12-04C]
MKIILKNLVFSLALTKIFALAFVLIFEAPVAASQNQQILNGLLHPTEDNFFKEGREQFEREIQMLLHQPPSSFDRLLKISPKLLQIQEERSPDASTTISPRTTERPAKSNQSNP